jgi:hypothetical protein
LLTLLLASDWGATPNSGMAGAAVGASARVAQADRVATTIKLMMASERFISSSFKQSQLRCSSDEMHF